MGQFFSKNVYILINIITDWLLKELYLFLTIYGIGTWISIMLIN